MTTYTLPEKPSLRQLKIQAKELLKAVHNLNDEAAARLRRHHPEFAKTRSNSSTPKDASLSDIQLVVAREYGFGNWAKLRAAVDGMNVARLDDAVKRGDRAEVEAILKTRPELVNIDAAGNNEHKPIHFAVLHNKPEILRLLLDHGADPHKGIYPNRGATTAYILAKERNYDNLVAIMDEEEERRRVAMQCKNLTVSPLQEELNAAIEKDARSRFEEILAEHPDMEEASDAKGRTPLHIAAASHRPDYVKRLLKNWACVRKSDTTGRTPLDSAVAAVRKRDRETYPQFLEVAELLLDHGAPLSPVAAAALGKIDELRTMLAERPVELADDTDWISGGLLTIAVRHDRKEVAQLLLDSGWDINEFNRLDEVERDAFSSGSPLRCASINQDYDTVEMLLKREADPNAMVYASGNALFCAYGNRDARMKELLRQYGAEADPEAIGLYRDSSAATVFLQSDREEDEIRRLLWASACGGDPETVRMCLQRFSSPPDHKGWFNLLEQPFRMWGHGPKIRYPDGDRQAYHECFRLMLEHGVDPNVEGRFNSRLLHFLMARGVSNGVVVMSEEERLQFAQTLVKHGAALDPRDGLLQSTPLGWACRWDRLDVVRFLLESGAPAQEPDAEPWATPLAWAEKRGHHSIVEMLREHSAKN